MHLYRKKRPGNVDVIQFVAHDERTYKTSHDLKGSDVQANAAVVQLESITAEDVAERASCVYPLMEYAKRYFCHLERRSSSLLCLASKRVEFSLEQRLCWEKGLLRYPLLYLSKEQKKTALQAFRNISGFMGNRSSGKDRKDHCDKLVRNIMPRADDLKDEIFCQLCKQITGNPNMNATLNGWLLLNICIVTFQPSATLSPHLEKFFYASVGSIHPEISQRAAECLSALQNTKEKPERTELPSRMEFDAIQQHTSIQVPVYLLDTTFLPIGVHSWTTCEELSCMIAERLDIKHKNIFAIHEICASQRERVCDTHERVVDLISLWERTSLEYKIENFPSKLLYKTYLFVPIDDDCVEEVNLMYMQAVNDVLGSVYICSLEEGVKLAAYQLRCAGDRQSDDFRKQLSRDIHLYMPANLLSSANRKSIEQQIGSIHDTLQGCSAHQAKLTYLKICENFKLFGSTFYSIQNSRDGRFPANLVVAIHFGGVTLINVENEASVAQFYYEDIVSWGYSPNSIVLVISIQDRDVEYVFKTNAGKVINDLMGAYVKYRMDEQFAW